MKSVNYILLALSLMFLACTEDPVEKNNTDNSEEQEKETVDNETSDNSITSYLTGSSEDINTNSSLGYLLAGGASDQKSWFNWMVNKSDGGDFVIIRTTDSEGYNDDSFIEGANSILTLVIDSKTKANSDFVREKIRAAEALFIAGGDQTEYYNYWNNTEVENSIHYLVNEKGVPVGGTSAGLAILGAYSYIPKSSGVISSEALNDPYHPYMESIKTDFSHIPIMDGIMTDSHFSEKDRLGRTITFMSRLITDEIVNGYQDIKAIAVDEFTAVAIEANGDAMVLGNADYEDYAFFFNANSVPDRCEENKPLHWVDGITAYAVKGRANPEISFNINDWSPLNSNAQLEQVNVENGTITNDIQQPD